MANDMIILNLLGRTYWAVPKPGGGLALTPVVGSPSPPAPWSEPGHDVLADLDAASLA